MACATCDRLEVAYEPGVVEAAQRRAGGEGGPPLLIDALEPRSCERGEMRVRRERRGAGRAGAPVPRAGGLAGVAAEQAVAEGGEQRGGEVPAVLDRGVRQAAAGVEEAGRIERARRARRQARGARAAVVGLGPVGWERHVGDQLAEEELAAERAVDEARVLADPPQSGPLRQLLLEQGGGVHGGTPRRSRLARGEEAPEADESSPDDAVVIGSAGVPGDSRPLGGAGPITTA